jgi:hypothetical protein
VSAVPGDSGSGSAVHRYPSEGRTHIMTQRTGKKADNRGEGRDALLVKSGSQRGLGRPADVRAANPLSPMALRVN